jgi:hypothetical protein
MLWHRKKTLYVVFDSANHCESSIESPKTSIVLGTVCFKGKVSSVVANWFFIQRGSEFQSTILSLYFFSLSLFLYISLSLTLLTLSFSHSLFLSLFLFLSISLSLTLSHSFFLSFFLFLSLSRFLNHLLPFTLFFSLMAQSFLAAFCRGRRFIFTTIRSRAHLELLN